MGFILSPSVNVREIDLSITVPAVASSIMGYAGAFSKGKCFERTLVQSESELVNLFGKPTNNNFEHFFTVKNALAYSKGVYVVRVEDSATAKNSGFAVFNKDQSAVSITAVADGGNGLIDITAISHELVAGDIVDLTFDTLSISGQYKVASVADADTFSVEAVFTSTDTGTAQKVGSTDSVEEWFPNEDEAITITYGTNEVIRFLAKSPGTWGNGVMVAVANYDDFSTANITKGVTFASQFEYAPASSDEIAVAVLVKDDDGSYVLVEKHLVSLLEDKKDWSGRTMYIESVLDQGSKYIVAFHNTSGTQNVLSFEATNLSAGVDGTITDSEIVKGYDLFANAEEFDVNILIDGANTSTTVHTHLTSIVEDRKDCVAVINPPKEHVVNVVDDSTILNNLITWRSTVNINSSYVAAYGNWKYQFDKYAGVKRWVPISGDIAGIYALTDYNTDPWWAPAGYRRGIIRNVIKLAWSPKKAARDALYKNQINPVVSPPNKGNVILGQKTMYSNPSAFDRVNVRRLFIVLEKAIATAAEMFMFEFNDPFTRQQFVAMVEPFLRDVKGRRGIQDFFVLCNEDNNTAEVVDRNEFIGDIFIKPNRVAEFIKLNFIAVKSGVDFTEVVEAYLNPFEAK